MVLRLSRSLQRCLSEAVHVLDCNKLLLRLSDVSGPETAHIRNKHVCDQPVLPVNLVTEAALAWIHAKEPGLDLPKNLPFKAQLHSSHLDLCCARSAHRMLDI